WIGWSWPYLPCSSIPLVESVVVRWGRPGATGRPRPVGCGRLRVRAPGCSLGGVVGAVELHPPPSAHPQFGADGLLRKVQVDAGLQTGLVVGRGGMLERERHPSGDVV